MSDSEKDVSALKNKIRKSVRALRDGLSQDERVGAKTALSRIDLSPLDIGPETIVAGYYPIRSECDCLVLLELASQAGAQTALPVIQGDEQGLLFRSWSPGDPMEKGQMAILEPVLNAGTVEPDLLFIPLLAFDKRGYRVGYGKGHYDRTITALVRKKAVTAVGVAFDCQEIEKAPCDQYDQPLDWVVTPSGLRKLGE